MPRLPLVWALALALLTGCSGEESVPPTPESQLPDLPAQPPAELKVKGRFFEPRRDPGLTPEQRAEIERLEAIGYVSGSQAAPERSGVLRHDEARAQAGLNLYTSGHASEAVLMDMDGEVLHRWSFPLARAWPELNPKFVFEDFWRRVLLEPDGSLVAIHEGIGLLQVDAASELVWRNPNRAHHDLERLPDGSLYVLTRA
ncbi:MAG: hypothetical protein ACR2P8_10220, partial [Myxococcota bacterium]